MPSQPRESSPRKSVRMVVQTWWPLAASWLLMGFELPAVSAVMARLPDPKVSLAAYGGVVFPVALLIEAPILMLLAASTALSKDWQSYRLGRAFMLASGLALTAVHALLAFTPLYYVVADRILGAPKEILEPGRLGLQIMTPWTISIAYRRFHQGVLIRFGHSRVVGIGTAIRLATNIVVLAAGYALGHLPGIAVGTLAVAAGVVMEAIYAGLAVHPVLRNQVRSAAPLPEPLRFAAFLRFYAPLALTSIILLAGVPMASAAMSRMPLALESLAVWPVVNGLVFTLRSVGFAFNEVVVSLLERPDAVRPLRHFSHILAAIVSGALLVIAATPLGHWWFARVSALPRELVTLSSVTLWISFLLPAITVWQSFYQGTIVHSHRTRGIPEAMAVFLLVMSALLVGGIGWQRIAGLYVGQVALVAGNAAQLAWLWWRARPVLRRLEAGHAPAAAAARADGGLEIAAG